jgi:microcystin-dependent protein
MDPFIGEIRVFAGTYAPDGWFECKGQLLQVSQYQALYAVIGNLYGGSAGTTFALPNLQGRAVVGEGTSSAGTQYVQGKQGGAEQSTIPSSANLPPHTHAAVAAPHNHSVGLPAHNHGFNVPAHTHPYTPQCDAGSATDPSPGGGYPANSGTPAYAPAGPDTMAGQTTGASDGTATGTTAQSAGTSGTSGDATINVAVQATGNGAAFSTMSPYLPLYYIIAYTGIFPPRP